MSRKNVEAIYPLSPAQQGMLFETICAPSSGVHFEQLTWILQGNLDISAFKQAWIAIVNRHSILRTGFVWKDQDEPLQVVLREVEVSLEYQDWCLIDSAEQQEKLKAYLKSDRDRGFQLSKPPLMRLALFQIDERAYQAVWAFHHILMDGWSGPILFKEFFGFYQAFTKGEELQLQPSRPYRDYITWLKKQDLSQAETFWRKTLEGFTKPTSLGRKVDIASLPEAQERYCEETRELPESATAALQSLVRQHRITLNTAIQGVWALLLSRYSGEEDVVFGITVSGRPSELAGCESTIGLFINTLPVRVRISPQAQFWYWLKDIQTYNLELRQYEYSSSGQVHQWSKLPGTLPLYESILVFENYPMEVSALGSSELAIDLDRRYSRFGGIPTNYPLTLLVFPSSKLKLQIIYDGRRLDKVDVSRILEHFLRVLNNLVATPEKNLAMLLETISREEIPKIRSIRQQKQPSIEGTSAHGSTPVEEVLMGIWTNVLGIAKLGIDDNFFELGGHSLLATQVMSRVRDTFQIELPLRCLFEAPTVTALAQHIEAAMKAGKGLQAPPLERVSRNGKLPLSFAQQRLWFLDRLNPGSISYNESSAVLLKGSLNVAALKQSFNEIIRRHEVLRTRFPAVDGQPFQEISLTKTLPLPVFDLREFPENLREAELLRLAKEQVQQPFNLAQGPLLRVTLLQLDEAEYAVLLVTHHIISDNWSIGVLIREIAALYEAFCAGKPSPLPELPIQYADFAVWQRQWLQGEVLETQLTYWKQQLGDNLPVLQLPIDRPRPAVQTFQGAKQSLVLSQTLSQELKKLSTSVGVTLFMTLLAGFQTLLHWYTGQDDIVVGTDVANRNQAETEGLIGFFVNQLVLRTNLGGNPTFPELLGRVREVTLGAYAHQDLPFEKLVEALNPKRDLNRTPLFQVKLVLQNAPMPPIELSGLTLESVDIKSGMTKFDLTLFISESELGLMVELEYDAELFNASTINRILVNFEKLLSVIVAEQNSSINELREMLDQANKQQQIGEGKQLAEASLQKLSKFVRRSNKG